MLEFYNHPKMYIKYRIIVWIVFSIFLHCLPLLQDLEYLQPREKKKTLNLKENKYKQPQSIHQINSIYNSIEQYIYIYIE